ncbi:hypothetical protein NYE48_23035 [Paenibacillus sp. FSL M7-1455]|uniref:Uncharacterized protein n=1 Tax=Paenibacillus cookii TaxID=157839 RepID=A0ABQ4M342_9BACL|nr:hypothetical protein [Paenibacillus cookii]GIO69848.1 hypothetical protein J21TS3_46690 [Paenibacillus cookii]
MKKRFYCLSYKTSSRIDRKFRLRGGWAIDVLAGKITRPHDDIDLITWIRNREQLEFALAEAGYEQSQNQ